MLRKKCNKKEIRARGNRLYLRHEHASSVPFACPAFRSRCHVNAASRCSVCSDSSGHAVCSDHSAGTAEPPCYDGSSVAAFASLCSQCSLCPDGSAQGPCSHGDARCPRCA